MRLLEFFLFILPSILSQHNHWWENSKVLDLTDQSFYTFVGRHQHVIVEFYAPWCFYCKVMAPEYERLRELYNGLAPKRTDVLIARIQGNSNEQTCDSYGVYSYPTILLFKKGEKGVASIFQSPQRTMEMMSEWIENVVGSDEEQDEPKRNIGEIVGEKKRDGEEIAAESKQEDAITDKKNKKEEINEETKKLIEEERKSYELLVTLAEEMRLLNKTVTNGFEELKREKEKGELSVSEKTWKINLQGWFPIVGIFFAGIAFGIIAMAIKNKTKKRTGKAEEHMEFKVV